MGCGKSKSVEQPSGRVELRTYTMAEVENCNVADENMLIVIEGNVYKPFKFIDAHPGGGEILARAAGRDVTKEFDVNPRHSDNARKMLKKYLVGMLEGKTDPTMQMNGASIKENCEDGTPIALKGLDDPIVVTLVNKKSISPNTFDFTFSLPSPDHVLGLPIGQHVRLLADITDENGKCEMDVGRSYTPTSTADQRGTFNLVIKVYFKDQHPKFPAGGKMTQHVNSMQIGDKIRIAGPKGGFEYKGQGAYESDYGGTSGKCTKLGFVCGGSGITPAYQVIQAIFKDPADTTSVSLIFANQKEDDILLRTEIDSLAAQHPTRFRRWYLLSQDVPAGWEFGTGRMSQEVIQEHMPAPAADTLVTACGPPGMIEGVVVPALTALGHAEDHIMVF